MPEYISREAVLSHKWKVRSYDPSDLDPVTEVVSVSSIVRIPAADVVEVVRCRDCVFGNMLCAMARYPDYFCADGKRKDGGQDE